MDNLKLFMDEADVKTVDKFYEEDGEDHKFKIHYELEVDLGTFLEEEHQRKILAEVLEVNGERVFETGICRYHGNR